MLTEEQSIPECCNAVMSMSRTLLSCSTDVLAFLSSAVYAVELGVECFGV
jgi:hypothetical protein